MKHTLTPQETALMPIVRDEWIKRALNANGKVDEVVFEKGIKWLYNDLLKKPTPKIVYVNSWMATPIAIAILKDMAKNKSLPEIGDTVGDTVWDTVRDTVGDTVWDTVRDTVRDTVWDTVWATVGDTVGDTVWATVGATVWDTVRDTVRDTVWDTVWDTVRDTVWDTVRDTVWDTVGATVGDTVRATVWEWSYRSSWWDYDFCAFYDYFTRIHCLDSAPFKQYEAMMKAGVMVMYPYENVVFAVRPPEYVKRNESGRLHCTTGPAVQWMDGSGMYYINGRSVPAEIIQHPEVITRQRFLSEKNAEIKGAIYEVLGQKKMFELLGAKQVDARTIVHKNGDLETVTLYKTKEKFAEIGNVPFAWVKMVCPSTGTNYLVGVQPHHTCALEAISSLSRFKPEEYAFTDRA